MLLVLSVLVFLFLIRSSSISTDQALKKKQIKKLFHSRRYHAIDRRKIWLEKNLEQKKRALKRGEIKG